MEKILQEITTKKAELDQLKPLPKALEQNLEDWYRIELTYTSNAIEGNTLSRQDTALVVEKGLTVEGKTLREHQEAVNHAEAFDYIKELAKIKKRKDLNERDILAIHALILRHIDDQNAGKFRNVAVRIAGSQAILPNPLKVPDLMEDFTKWLKTSRDHPVKIAADTHFKLVSIHPFTDGNGRTARLLMNLILFQEGYPPAIIRKEDRRIYLNAIEKAQLTGKLDDYCEIIYKAEERSLAMNLEMAKPEEYGKNKKIALKKLLKIGELAKLASESVSTIRFWTNEDLLKVAKHTKGGYALYAQEQVEMSKKIRQLQDKKRLTIEEIKKRV